MNASGAGTPAYALRFISGKWQGAEVPLRGASEIVIGRGSELQLVLAEEMVSRRHARLTVIHGVPTIEDLGSTNGTFVNGERVQKARLKEGDRILIGTSIIKFVQESAGGAPTLDEAAAAQARRGSSIRGSIDEIPLPDLLQLLSTSRKSGVLVVRSATEGRIHFQQGKVRHAAIEREPQLSARRAFNRIVTWEKGDFELSAQETEPAAEAIDAPLEALLMEALRQLDEYNRSARDLPHETARLVLTVPLRAPLRDLTPEQLDVLQLVLNRGSLRGVLDGSESEDARTALMVLDLIERQYVRVG